MSSTPAEFYFTQSLTECEHDIVEAEMREWAAANGLEVVYYRKFKTGHVPCQRETKVRGAAQTISRFKTWAEGRECPVRFQNYWQTEEWQKEKAWRELLAARGVT